MAPLPDVPLSYGPMLTGVFINLILYGVFLGQALTYYQQYRRCTSSSYLPFVRAESMLTSLLLCVGTMTHGCDTLYVCIARASAEACTPSSFIRTSEAMQSSIRALLRPSDTVKVVLEALVVPPANDTDAPDPLSPSPSLLRNRRVLAVVAHSDSWPQYPGGGQYTHRIFILKVKHTSERAFNQSDILRVFPIFGSFSITVAQVRRETWPLPLAQSSSSPGLLSLMTKQGDIEGLDPLTLCTQHVRTLRDALAECKRLKEIADAPPTSAAPPLTTFSWLAPYTSRRAPSLHIIRPPTDLRTAQTPLHMRLSAAFAGEPGHHAADFVLIRDEWIHNMPANHLQSM
ncbi:hypothetical protein K438DRAFT_1982144 [Mycena galopus ATCC 62051]|nr:hypothetical protein K438DRAFT_1982144 [Mycena galopus ATCC 62051]